MKKLFISLPMNGRNKEEIFEEMIFYKKVVEEHLGEKVELLDTYFDLGENARDIDYIAKSIEYLAKADIVYFGRGWRSSRGCRIEHDCCDEYGHAMIHDELCIMKKQEV